MTADLYDPFDARPRMTKAEQERWEAAKFGTVEALKPRSPAESDRIIDMIARGIDNSETRRYLRDTRTASPIVTPAERAKRFRGRNGAKFKRYDHEQIVLMYKTGMTVKEIQEKTGAHPDTLRPILRKAGVYDPNRDKTGGKGKSRNRQEVCAKGHELNEENVLWSKDSKTGKQKRECKRCKYDRNNQYKKNKRSSGNRPT